MASHHSQTHENGQSPDVLLVDDDTDTRRVVMSYLAEHDIPAREASGREEMNRQLALREPALIILDLQLGEDDGLDVLRAIRSSSDVPVIIATGRSLEEIDCVVGLELGADSYVTKPFSLRELLARVRTVLRRLRLAQPARVREAQRGGYEFGGWCLECDSRKLMDPGGRPLALSNGEYALLVAFLETPLRPLTREQLLQATRVHEDIFGRSIDVQILRLRRKLEADASSPRIIRTERRIGYVFTLPVKRL
jgi:DNA-binding response OmpR family regulator